MRPMGRRVVRFADDAYGLQLRDGIEQVPPPFEPEVMDWSLLG